MSDPSPNNAVRGASERRNKCMGRGARRLEKAGRERKKRQQEREQENANKIKPTSFPFGPCLSFPLAPHHLPIYNASRLPPCPHTCIGTQALRFSRSPKLVGEASTTWTYLPSCPFQRGATPPQALTHMDNNKARLREVQVQVFQGSKPQGPQRDIFFDGKNIRCGGAVIQVRARASVVGEGWGPARLVCTRGGHVRVYGRI